MTNQSKQSTPIWILLVAVGVGVVLMGAAVLLLVSGNATVPASTADTANIPYPTVQRISVTDAHAMMQSGAAILVDVRDAAAYSESHVSGAIAIPEADLAARIGELSKEQLIITYCT